MDKTTSARREKTAGIKTEMWSHMWRWNCAAELKQQTENNRSWSANPLKNQHKVFDLYP